jgi:hypothetical protein
MIAGLGAAGLSTLIVKHRKIVTTNLPKHGCDDFFAHGDCGDRASSANGTRNANCTNDNDRNDRCGCSE